MSLRLNKPYHKVYPQKVCFYFPFPAPMHQGNYLSIYCLQNKSRNNDSGFGRMEYVSKGQAFWNQSSFNTAMKASWGISTLPTCFIRFSPPSVFPEAFSSGLRHRHSIWRGHLFISFNRFSCNNLTSYRCLDRHLKLLARNNVFQAERQYSATGCCIALVDNNRQRVNKIPVQ